MSTELVNQIEHFLCSNDVGNESISNEHGLQMELGIYLRNIGYRVEFEQSFRLTPRPDSTKTPKRELDILITQSGIRTAIELKAPLAGRVPESMYDFCADMEFVEQLIESRFADRGFCLLVTNNRQFWYPPTATGGIYDFFRIRDCMMSGKIFKPTGLKDTNIALAGIYRLGAAWRELGNTQLINNCRYLFVEMPAKHHPNL